MGISRHPAAPSGRRALVVGAGVGGLSAAALLARQGWSVQVLEAAAQPGGKLSPLQHGGHQHDAGPTVLTMRWVFEAWFDALGLSLPAALNLRRCEVLARHAWDDGKRLDLLQDLDASVAAIGEFSGREQAERYRAFCHRAREVYQTLEGPFMRQARPSPWSLAWQAGWRGLPALCRISPFSSLWEALGRYFPDPRLHQLFGRYATYCGASPFQAPATLMLVAHVEREAVWQLDGGLHRLADAMSQAARQQGVTIRCNTPVAEVLLGRGGVRGVRLAHGEELPADVVLFNGDVAALRSGLLGPAVSQALGGPPRAAAAAGRSLSAVTWHLEADTSGFELSHHNVFFSDPRHDGYRAEFEAIAQGRLPEQPSVYVCAQDRHAGLGTTGGPPPAGPERLMCLVNAPATADQRPLNSEELQRCEQQMWARLQRAGLNCRPTAEPSLRRSPSDFAQRYPATGGALYGMATHGWRSSFQRPTARTRIPGLFLAGGSVHPGPGVPMAALSGQLAAQQILAAWPSTARWALAPMPGGTSTP